MRKALLIAASFAALTMAAQETEDAPSFEVISVKPNPSQTGPSAIRGTAPGRFTASNTPLRFVILYAYHLLDNQLKGTPEWTSSDSFDIAATYPPGRKSTDDDIRGMVRQLLSVRFGLRAHREQQQQPAYLLTIASKTGQLGKQLHPSQLDCEHPLPPSAKQPLCRMIATRRSLTGGTRTMAQLAVTLQSIVARPIADHTGLIGAFDLDLKWDDNEGPSIFTALQEQLGLKLEPGRDSFDTLIIDHVEKPTAN